MDAVTDPSATPRSGCGDGCGCHGDDTAPAAPAAQAVHSPHDEHAHHGHDGHDEHPHHGPIADASVRRAKASDAPAVGLVQAAVWRDTFHDVLPEPTLAMFEGPAFASTWRHALQKPPSPRHELLIACAGDQVVGFAATGPAQDPDADDRTADLLAFGVHPQARRAGHGSRLVNALVDRAREHGFDHLTAWVPIPAESARALLVAAGMGPDGARRQRVVDPDGSTVMEVRLSASLGTDDPA